MLSSGFRGQQGQVNFSELLRGQVHEFILDEEEAIVWVFVGSLDEIVVVAVDSHSVPFLIWLRVFLSVLLLPLEEILNHFVGEGLQIINRSLLVHHVEGATE